MLWPVLIWSAMGTNEGYYRTHQLIFTAIHPVRNQFIVLWLAGIIVAYLTGSGAMNHFVITGDWERLALQQSLERGLFLYYLLASIVLLILAAIGRVRQVKMYQ